MVVEEVTVLRIDGNIIRSHQVESGSTWAHCELNVSPLCWQPRLQTEGFNRVSKNHKNTKNKTVFYLCNTTKVGESWIVVV